MKTQNKIFIIFLLSVAFLDMVYSQNVPRQLMKEFPSWINEKGERPHPDAKILENGLFTHIAPVTELYSDSNKKFAGTRDGKLYLRNQTTDSIKILLEPDHDWYWSMSNAMWSPNGIYLASKQIDDSKVPEIEIIKSNPKETIKKKYSRAGDALPEHRFYVINVKTGDKVEVKRNENLPYIHLLQWSNDSQELYFLMSDRLLKEVLLISVDAKTGKETILLSETSDTYLIGLDLLQGYSKRLIDSKQVVFLEDRNQFTWMSERNGYNQIYLYDDLGNLVRPLTTFSENGIVISIVEIDKLNDWIYFKAHANKNDPYEIQLFRTNLNNPGIEKITDASGILDVFFQESKDTLWLFRSQLPKTLQIERYAIDGRYIDTPWQVDSSIISDNQLNHEYEWVMAADGTTQLQSLILKPMDFDPNRKYPVVEYIYGASFNNVVVRDLLNNWLWDMNKLVQEGIIVVFIDGRGTSERGKKFQDYSYGKFGQIELQDHIGALKQLGKKRPYMDLNRVGVFGHSWGGHFALRALLEAPEFYKAGHINAAALDPIDFRIAIEPFMGCLPDECPEKYKKSAISNKLNRLKAPLMIVHGTYDDDVPIDDSYKLVSQLEKLNYNNYEFVVYDGADHIVMRDRNWLPQMIKFFITKLK